MTDDADRDDSLNALNQILKEHDKPIQDLFKKAIGLFSESTLNANLSEKQKQERIRGWLEDAAK
jgi:hypothetical protein